MDTCILIKPTKEGYGQIYDSKRKKSIPAHRLAYSVVNGLIPDGFVVRHLCFVKNCINPNHLELGTPQDNAQDADRASLTLNQVADIKQRLVDNKGKSFNRFLLELAGEYEVSKWTIKNIKQLRAWDNVRPDLNFLLQEVHSYSNITDAHFDIESRMRAARVLLLRYKYGLSNQKIADIVGLGETQVYYINKGERHKNVYDWYMEEVMV